MAIELWKPGKLAVMLRAIKIQIVTLSTLSSEKYSTNSALDGSRSVGMGQDVSLSFSKVVSCSSWNGRSRQSKRAMTSYPVSQWANPKHRKIKTETRGKIFNLNNLYVISLQNLWFPAFLYLGDGTYIVSYMPEVNGKHEVSVAIQDKPIMGSPFTVVVINRREYSDVGATLLRFGQYGSKKREFKSPFGVAVDHESYIYVADSYNHRIQVFGPRGEYVTQFGSHGERKGEFNCPTDVAIDSKGRIIVCDNGNNRIQVLNRNGGFIGKFGREGTTNGFFKSPWGVATSKKNDILVADMENHRVQVFSPEGKFVSKFGSYGCGSENFNSPCYLLVNPENEHIFVSDSKNHRIQEFDKNGKFLRQIGSQGSGEGQFSHPRGLAVDIVGNLVIADMGNHRFQILTAKGRFIKEAGSEGSGDGQLSFPESVAIMPNSGYIVVSDLSNNRLQVF